VLVLDHSCQYHELIGAMVSAVLRLDHNIQRPAAAHM
jgi:hypothetical protein